jgi:hypothetical protein
MRTYGRITNADGTKTWKVVETDAAGFDDYVWVTTLTQCLKLILGESPFYANYGIPAQLSVLQQIFPDFYVNQTQQQFAPRFASLIVSRQPALDRLHINPVYSVNVVTNFGVKIAVSIPT